MWLAMTCPPCRVRDEVAVLHARPAISPITASGVDEAVGKRRLRRGWTGDFSPGVETKRQAMTGEHRGPWIVGRRDDVEPEPPRLEGSDVGDEILARNDDLRQFSHVSTLIRAWHQDPPLVPGTNGSVRVITPASG